MENLIEQFKEFIQGLTEPPEGFHYEVWDVNKLLFEVPEREFAIVVCRDDR